MNVLRFCTMAPEINLNPYRSAVPALQSDLLKLVTRPFIGRDGIISAMSFSADGLEMTARVAPGVAYASGKRVTGKDAAYGLAALLRYRIPVRGFLVTGTENMIESANWMDKTFAGIEILGEDSFKLRFTAGKDVENIPGVLRELLERQHTGPKTTFWLADPRNQTDFVARYEVVSAAPLAVKFEGQHIEFSRRGSCSAPDFFDFADGNDGRSDYELSLSSGEITMVSFLNSGRLGLEERRALGAVLQSAAQALTFPGTRTVGQLIEMGEAGATSAHQGKLMVAGGKLKKRNVRILTNSQKPYVEMLKAEIERRLRALGVSVSFALRTENDPAEAYDAFIVGYPITSGRQKWMQGSITNMKLTGLLAGAPKTHHALNVAQAAAAATVPIKAQTITDIEAAAIEEVSIVPLVRTRRELLTKRGSPISVQWGDHDEPFFTREAIK